MAIQSHEEWMTEFFNERCSCGIVTFTINDGDNNYTVKMATAAFTELEDIDSNAKNQLHQFYSEWYDNMVGMKVEEVSHSEFLKITNCKAYEIGDKVNNGRFGKIIEAPNSSIQKKGECMERFEQYELDHEDDDEF